MFDVENKKGNSDIINEILNTEIIILNSKKEALTVKEFNNIMNLLESNDSKLKLFNLFIYSDNDYTTFPMDILDFVMDIIFIGLQNEDKQKKYSLVLIHLFNKYLSNKNNKQKYSYIQLKKLFWNYSNILII